MKFNKLATFFCTITTIKAKVSAVDEYKQSIQKDGVDGVNPSDGSMIVNSDGLHGRNSDKFLYERQKIVTPKNMPRLSIDQVAAQARKSGLHPVASLMMFAKDNEMRHIPESVVLVAEQQLEHATENNKQQVTYGSLLDGDDRDSDNGKESTETTTSLKKGGKNNADTKDDTGNEPGSTTLNKPNIKNSDESKKADKDETDTDEK